eukprot:SM000119S25646  [mRNA]  locus=s119:188895:189117:- [translate_table: standard]
MDNVQSQRKRSQKRTTLQNTAEHIDDAEGSSVPKHEQHQLAAGKEALRREPEAAAVARPARVWTAWARER